MKTVEMTIDSNANAEQVWNILKTGDEVDQFLPFIASCDLHGQGEGAKRVCSMADGKTLIESILTIDHENKVFEYGIDSHSLDFPTKDIRGAMQVVEEDGKVQLNWKINYNLSQELDEEAYAELENNLYSMMQMGLEGLDSLAKARLSQVN